MTHYKQYLPYLFSLLLALAILFWIRWGFLCTGGEYEPDCFFHARIAEQGPSVFCAKKFPWLTKSSWAEQFSDKELGFHFLLWGFIRIGKLFGLTNEYPFHCQVLFFDAILLFLFNVLLFRQKIKPAWLYNILLITAFLPITYRLLSLRAYLLSMSLSALILILFMEKSFRTWRWRFALLGGIGFAASWCYSSPHLLLFMILPFVCADFLANRKWLPLFLTPGSFLAGILLGLTIHPQFPNSFIIFKEQCIDVILAFFLHVKDIPVMGGNEFYASTLNFIAMGFYGYPLLILSIIAFLVVYRKQLFPQDWQKDSIFNGLLLLTISLTAISYKIFRFTEYSIIPQCFALAVILSRIQQGLKAKEPQQQNSSPNSAVRCIGFSTLYAGAITAFCAICSYIQIFNIPSHGMGQYPCVPLADWIEEKNIPKGTIIANTIWSSFPMLYYSLPEYRFTWGLDPAFSWEKAPDVARLMADLKSGIIHEPRDYMEVYGTNYFFFYQDEYREAEHFWKSGFPCIYDNVDGWLFDLSLPQRSNPPPLIMLEIKKNAHEKNNE